jgi:hypothetical protein
LGVAVIGLEQRTDEVEPAEILDRRINGVR